MIQAISTSIQNKPNIKPKKLQAEHVAFSAPITLLPQGERNYCIFNQNKVDFIASQKENALPYIKKILQTSSNEGEITEALYTLDCMIENRTKGVASMYPYLSKLNSTNSPNIQVFLAGIYRKTQVPDAFGPLVAMLVNNTKNPKTTQNFDPNEEIGGAILEYINRYSKEKPQIDYNI